MFRSAWMKSTSIVSFVLLQWTVFFCAYVSAQSHRQLPPPAQPHNSSGNDTTPQLVCVPFGTCEPCPPDALHEPFCQPFGNRRLMHCVPAPPDSHLPSSPLPPSSPHHLSAPMSPHANFANSPPPSRQPQPHTHQDGEIPAWESCGRIIEKERADFYEFLACNLAIALLAVFVVFARSKRLQAMQARQLAARIGLVRSAPGGWGDG